MNGVAQPVGPAIPVIRAPGLAPPSSSLPPVSIVPYQNTLPAAGQPGSSIPVIIGGNQFYLESSSGPLLIQPIGGDVAPYSQGEGADFSPSSFTQLRVSNPSNVPVTFNLIVGTATFIDRRLILDADSLSTPLFVQNPATKTLGGRIQVSNAGVAYPGTANGTKLRKTFIVQNIDQIINARTNSLLITDSGTRDVCWVTSGSPPVAIETSDELFVFGEVGGITTVAAAITEIYINQ